MAKIDNRTTGTYDLSHVYIADRDDDNAERKMLKEAEVQKVTINSLGEATFQFKVAGESGLIDASDDKMELYLNIEAYRASSKRVGATYKTIAELLADLGIDSSLFESFKSNPNATPVLVPKGFFINDKTMVEEVSFPENWEFTRTVVKDSETDQETTIWKHNAGWAEKTVYATRETALENHKIKLLRLNGVEDEV